MIRINLVKSVQNREAQPIAGMGEVPDGSNEVQRQGLVKLVIILLFPISLWLYESQLIPELHGQLASKSQVLASLQQKNQQARGVVEEMKKFKEDQAKLQKQIDTIEGLRRERLKEVKVMDNLQKDIPEKVWLTRIQLQEGKLTISGLATADSELTQFMESLSKSVFLQDVNLVRSSEQPMEGGVFKKFDISCVIAAQSPGEPMGVGQ